MRSFLAAIAYVHLPTLGRMLVLNLAHRPHWRRILFTLVFLTLHLAVTLLVFAGRLLDELLLPFHRRVAIRQPIFIISNPRSGTTLLHRLLCLDEDRFSYPLLYHTILPSASLILLIRGIGWLERPLGRPLHRLFNRLDGLLFRGWAHIHPMGFNQSEEDEGLFTATFLTPAIYLLCPFPEQMPAALHLPGRLPPRVQQALMAYYIGSLKRIMFATGGGGRIFLSKNVMTTGRFQMLLAAFPEARIVYITRTPLKAVPSFISMFSTPWRLHSPDLRPDGPQYQAIGHIILDFYRYFHDQKDRLPPEQFLWVRYEDLINDPLALIERIYAHFGLSLSPRFRARWVAEVR